MSRQRGARTETAAQRLERLATTARDGRRGVGDRLPVDSQQPCTTVVVAVDRELANVVLKPAQQMQTSSTWRLDTLWQGERLSVRAGGQKAVALTDIDIAIQQLEHAVKHHKKKT